MLKTYTLLDMKNINEFRLLIKRYETLTLEEAKEAFLSDNIEEAIKDLTGYGYFNSCSLCNTLREYVTPDCCKCVYGSRYACISGIFEESYNAIGDAETPEEYITAIRNRAKVMRNELSRQGLSSSYPCTDGHKD